VQSDSRIYYRANRGATDANVYAVSNGPSGILYDGVT